MIALLLLSASQAASLDLLEVGGLWGSPGATNPTAVWWNPAGLARAKGTQILVEGAPTFGAVSVDRFDPGYSLSQQGALEQLNGNGFPTDIPDYSGNERFTYAGVAPFVGVSSDLGVRGLGVGASLSVPFAKGGASDTPGGPSRFFLREGNIRAAYLSAAASYKPHPLISVGASISLVDSLWTADTDNSFYVDLSNEILEELGGVRPLSIQDVFIEDERYATNVDFGNLTDRAITFGVGVSLEPVADKVGISLAYNHGVSLSHTGGVDLSFSCAPDYDVLSLEGFTERGLCNARFAGDATVDYTLPSRIHAGVVVTPTDRWRLEAMGAVVMWSSFDDYDIQLDVDPSQIQAEGFDSDDPEIASEAARLSGLTADIINRPRKWARDNHTSFWVGADGKYDVSEKWTVGSRWLFDRAAVPNATLSPNNVDFNAIIGSGQLVFHASERFDFGLSISHQLWFARTNNESAFAQTVDATAATEDRFFYPSANGRYSGFLTRLGISVAGHFGGND